MEQLLFQLLPRQEDTKKSKIILICFRLVEERRLNAGNLFPQPFQCFLVRLPFPVWKIWNICHCYAMNSTVDRISESLTIICWAKAILKSHHDVWERRWDWKLVTMNRRQDYLGKMRIMNCIDKCCYGQRQRAWLRRSSPEYWSVLNCDCGNHTCI